MPDDDFFIRRFARLRDRGDMDAALEVWEQACVRKFDLIAGLIRRFRFPGGQILAPDDRDEAQGECMMRVLQMGQNFRGRTGAEFRAGIKRAVWFACMDVGRDVMAHEKLSGGSLDKGYEDSHDGGPFDAAVERYLSERAAQAADADAAEDELEREYEIFDWAIDQVDNENHRVVLELTFRDRLTGEAIAERLGITLNNVYKRRERGIKKVEAILRDHRP